MLPLQLSPPLVRRKEPRFLLDVLQSPAVQFTIVKGTSVLTKQPGPDARPALSWLSSEQLEDDAMLVRHGGVFQHGGGPPHKPRLRRARAAHSNIQPCSEPIHRSPSCWR